VTEKNSRKYSIKTDGFTHKTLLAKPYPCLSVKKPPRANRKTLGGFIAASSGDLLSRFPPEILGDQQYLSSLPKHVEMSRKSNYGKDMDINSVVPD